MNKMRFNRPSFIRLPIHFDSGRATKSIATAKKGANAAARNLSIQAG